MATAAAAAASGAAAAVQGARMDQMQAEIDRLHTNIGAAVNQLQDEKVKFMDAVQVEFAKGKLELDTVVMGARTEFQKLEAMIRELYNQTDTAVGTLHKRLTEVEANGGKRKDNKTEYLPMKTLVPDVFSDKAEDWRAWKDDLSEYLDAVRPGMKKFLEEVAKCTVPLTDEWLTSALERHSASVVFEQVPVWRTIKRLTKGEARKLVMSVKKEDGFAAWQKMQMRFELGLASKQGLVIADLSAMVTKPAKTPQDTRALISELEQKIANVEEVTNRDVDETHAKSILIGLLDPTTRQQTAMNHGMDTGFAELKKLVLEFINNVSAPSAMSLDKVTEKQQENENDQDNGEWKSQGGSDDSGWEKESEDPGALAAMGRGSVKCHNCSGYGHMAKECPSKGRNPKGGNKGSGKGGPKGGKGGKGEEKGKGSNKGSGKGENGNKGGKAPQDGTGCWNCGGQHFASQCPRNRGKGAYGLWGEQEAGDWNQEVRSLCGVWTKTVLPTIGEENPDTEVENPGKEEQENEAEVKAYAKEQGIPEWKAWEDIQVRKYAEKYGIPEWQAWEEMEESLEICGAWDELTDASEELEKEWIQQRKEIVQRMMPKEIREEARQEEPRQEEEEEVRDEKLQQDKAGGKESRSDQQRCVWKSPFECNPTDERGGEEAFNDSLEWKPPYSTPPTEGEFLTASVGEETLHVRRFGTYGPSSLREKEGLRLEPGLSHTSPPNRSGLAPRRWIGEGALEGNLKGCGEPRSSTPEQELAQPSRLEKGTHLRAGTVGDVGESSKKPADVDTVLFHSAGRGGLGENEPKCSENTDLEKVPEKEPEWLTVKSKAQKRKERKARRDGGVRTQKIRMGCQGYQPKPDTGKEPHNKLGMFKTIEPEGLSRVEGTWEVIDLAVDSGATETVVSDDMLSTVDTKEGVGSRRGVKYEVANGVEIPNLGEKKFIGVSQEGTKRNITAQVCDVNKALLSVRKMINAGNKVVFDSEGSFVEDKTTGEKMWLRDEGGMFYLRMWVPTQPDKGF